MMNKYISVWDSIMMFVITIGLLQEDAFSAVWLQLPLSVAVGVMVILTAFKNPKNETLLVMIFVCLLYVGTLLAYTVHRLIYFNDVDVTVALLSLLTYFVADMGQKVAAAKEED